ncbi:MAG: hypothetical protein WKF72_12750, partial [Nocardioidaceae bacterium]
MLAFAWRTSRFDGARSGRPLPRPLARLVDSPVTRAVLVVLALAFTAWVAVAAVFGPDILVNPTFGSVYVLLWVGLVPAALLFGRVYRLCNPLRWLHRGISRLAGIDPHQGLFAYPMRLGYWPAAFFLFCFVWFELVDPQVTTSLSAVRLWFAIVSVLLLLGAAVFGDTWFEYADPFEAYSTLVAHLSPFARRPPDTDQHLRAGRLLCRGDVDIRRCLRRHRRDRPSPPTTAPEPASALRRTDRRRLHRGSLPVVLRRDGHPDRATAR